MTRAKDISKIVSDADFAGTLDVVGKITADAGVDIDNINIDGTTIALSSGDLTLDVAGDIILDADGAQIRLKDNGTQFGLFGNESSDFAIQSSVQDKDILFQGNDGGAGVTALTLDMSDAGTATFNSHVRLGDNKTASFGSGNDIEITSDGTNGTIAAPNGTLTIDVAGDITLDADGGDIFIKDGGTERLRIITGNAGFIDLYSGVSDQDFRIRGNDGGSIVNALTFDMSEAGRASFNSHVDMSGTLIYSAVGSGGITIQTTPSGNHTYIPLRLRNSSGTVIGSIECTTSSTTFNTSSDYRLKENVSYSFDATTRLKQLKPARFNFIVDADTTVDGFIAHEVSSIVPEAITGAKDATESMTNVVLNADGTRLTDDVTEEKWVAGKLSTTDEDGNTVDPIYASDTTWVASQTVPKYQSIDQSKLVPLLVKTIQELEARITTLENA